MTLADRLAARARLGALKQKLAAQANEPPASARLTEKTSAKLDSARRRNPNPDVQEIVRICDLRVMPRELTAEQVESISRANILAPAFEKGARLLEPQARAITAYDMVGGGFFPIGVGWGKTGISLMIAERGWRKGFETIILQVPPSTAPQLVTYDIGWWRARVPLSVPFHDLSGRSKAQRLKMARSGRKGCYILPYSLLSTEDSVEVIRAINPRLVICDEGHNLKNFSAARTRRLMKFVEEAEPEFVVASGTITDKGVEDYHHLITAALGDHSPLPLSHMMAMQWGVVLNSGAQPSENQAGTLMPLIEWAREHFPDEDLPPIVSGFRRAYRLRLTSAPGVVCTGDAEIGVSLTIANRAIEQPERWAGYDELMGLIGLIEDEYVTPNGDEIQHAIHTHKWLSELSCGFYNELKWPEPSVLAKRRNITPKEASDQIERAMAHHKAQQVYNKELREFLMYGRAIEGADTPRTVGLAIMRGQTEGMPAQLVHLWGKAHALKFENMPERDATAIRVCSFKVDDAINWARHLPKGKGGIIWYYHQELGAWLMEVGLAAGLPMLHCPAGANDIIRDERNANKVMVASIMAHETGKNLQFMQESYVLQWPRSARVAEQMLGRTHRTGQLADELIVQRCDVLPFDVLNFAACLNDAVYRQQTLGTREKVVFCNYAPMPAVFSPEFLREQGLQPHLLTAEQRQMLRDKFGDFQSEGAEVR